MLIVVSTVFTTCSKFAVIKFVTLVAAKHQYYVEIIAPHNMCAALKCTAMRCTNRRM